MRPNRILAGLAVASSLTAGAAAGALIAVPTVATAQETETPETTLPDTTAPEATPAPGGGAPDDGKDGERCRPGGHRGARLANAAEVIGISPEELREALESGQTLAEVAEANGVDPEALVDALIADATARLDEAVEDGRLTEEQAAEKEAELGERITDAVNGESDFRGPPGPRGPRGPRGFDGPPEGADADGEAEEQPALF